MNLVYRTARSWLKLERNEPKTAVWADLESKKQHMNTDPTAMQAPETLYESLWSKILFLWGRCNYNSVSPSTEFSAARYLDRTHPVP